MKKCILISMLLILTAFSIFINPSEEIAQYSFHPADEPAITATDAISDSDVIMESVQTIIHKYQMEFLFPSTVIAHALKRKPIPFQFINHARYSTKTAGFISVIQHQSNYLS